MNTKFFSSALVALGLAVSLSSCDVFRDRETAGQYVDDTTITTDVKAKIFAEKDLKSFDIGVETFKGDVQLSGFVDRVEQISHAGQVAKSVKGVRKVTNNLNVHR